MKSFKVLDIINYIHIECIKKTDTNDCSPYRLYLVYTAKHETYNYYTKRKKQIAKYGDFESVLCMIKDMFVAGVQYKPIDMILKWCNQYCND